MNVVSEISRKDFYQLMREGLEQEILTIEEIIAEIVWHEKGVFADEELAVNTFMKFLDSL